MGLVKALHCPVCYGTYVDGKNVKEGTSLPEECKQAGEIKGFPDPPIKSGLVLRGERYSDEYLHLIVIRSKPEEIINDDIGQVFFDLTERTVLEPGYTGPSMGGNRDHVEKDPNGWGGPGAGLENIPLRKLWGGHSFYSKANQEDIEELIRWVKEKRFPPSWNSAVPLDDLHFEPNPFFP